MATYHGCIPTPADAVWLFEACRLGILPRVRQRLTEKECESIKSGSVFVWDQQEAGIQRWTDGKLWGSSRVSGNFLVYREMEGKRKECQSNMPPAQWAEKYLRGDGERMEIGRPVKNKAKVNGLIKRLFSLKTSTGKHLHIMSYYTKQHFQSNSLPRPLADPQLRHIRPAREMYPGTVIRTGREQQPPPPYKGRVVRELPDAPVSPDHSKQQQSSPSCRCSYPQGYMTPEATPTPPTTSRCASVDQDHRHHDPLPSPPYNRSVTPLPKVSVLRSSPISLPPINKMSHMATPPLPNLPLPNTPTLLQSVDKARRTPPTSSISYMMNPADRLPGIGADKSNNIQASMENSEHGTKKLPSYDQLNAWVEDHKTIKLFDRSIVF